MSNVFFDRLQAEEFLEVYKDVVPDYVDHVLQLSNGPAIALEVIFFETINVCMYVSTKNESMYVYMYVCIYVCMYVGIKRNKNRFLNNLEY